ncbi:hypothetical protein AXF42_Ash007954 [Apostasia shenzhenica]|uniref:Uncharacterized protein n=1 Tax=Apostasia shenzhenica TaxID=1088818 RepID=A0A2I0B5S5_9ASPA|nr:hypothetical protein AXF42_Ash007954 [Apostasia shenzhenica]
MHSSNYLNLAAHTNNSTTQAKQTLLRPTRSAGELRSSSVAEDDFELLGCLAIMRQRRAIVRVGERHRTTVLEILRVHRRPASARAVIHITAAQLVGAERLASTLTPNYRPVPRRNPKLQCRRAGPYEILTTADDGAEAAALVWSDGHGNVEAVNEADAVGGEIAVATVVEGDLGESGGGGAADAAAFEAAGAVAGGAGEVGAGVGAQGAGPYSTGPVVGGGGKGAVGERWEAKAPALEDVVAGVGGDRRADGKRTVVHHRKGHPRVLRCRRRDERY